MTSLLPPPAASVDDLQEAVAGINAGQCLSVGYRSVGYRSVGYRSVGYGSVG
jgi:hypothetical protein